MIYNYDDLSFRVLTIDRFFHKEGDYNVKARPYAALSLRTRGTGDFEIGSKRIITKPGDILFLPADIPYKVHYSVSESIVVHFEHCNYFEAENICFENKSEIAVSFLHLLEVWSKRHSINQAKSIIYGILEKIESKQRITIGDTAIADCICHIDANFCNPQISIESVCAAAFVSVSTLQRSFAKYYGMSPWQYLIQLRMNQALELLKENELTVKEICFACGFTDEKYFSRAFKKRYGSPPSQFRKHLIV